MKNNILIILLICSLLILIGCKNTNETIPPPTAGNCMDVAFMETYLYFQNDDIFFIKGVALDIIEYGRNIRIIEDMKGNFKEKSTIFVWGGGNPPNDGGVYLTVERLDNITSYNKNDTLIMLVKKIDKERPYTIEKPGEYATLDCACSVLKLSNTYVSGRIFPYWEKEDLWWINMSQEEWYSYVNNLSWDESFSVKDEQISWEKFNELIETVNKIKQ